MQYSCELFLLSSSYIDLLSISIVLICIVERHVLRSRGTILNYYVPGSYLCPVIDSEECCTCNLSCIVGSAWCLLGNSYL